MGLVDGRLSEHVVAVGAVCVKFNSGLFGGLGESSYAHVVLVGVVLVRVNSGLLVEVEPIFVCCGSWSHFLKVNLGLLAW